MDRGEFAASLSEEQEEFIDNRIEGFLTLMNTCINEYKDNPSAEALRRIEDNWLSASTLHFLLNKYPLWEYTELYVESIKIFLKMPKKMLPWHNVKR